jgi:hypothetical protein
MTIHFYLPPIPEMLVWDEGDPIPRIARSVTLEPERSPVTPISLSLAIRAGSSSRGGAGSS